MVVRVRQLSRVRPGGRVRIRSNMANRRVSIKAPRLQRVKIKV